MRTGEGLIQDQGNKLPSSDPCSTMITMCTDDRWPYDRVNHYTSVGHTNSSRQNNYVFARLPAEIIFLIGSHISPGSDLIGLKLSVNANYRQASLQITINYKTLQYPPQTQEARNFSNPIPFFPSFPFPSWRAVRSYWPHLEVRDPI